MKSAETRSNTSWMIPGRKCWVEMPQKAGIEKGFELGVISSVNAGQEMAQIKYKFPRENLPDEVHISKISEVNDNIPEKGYDDMVNMNCLNEAELLHNIDLRYSQNVVYTYIGPTLLFLNPYKNLPATFSQEVLEIFGRKVDAKETFNLKDAMPHVYAISAKAYKQLFDNKKSQAIVISGESGAGKTENAKYAMKFLTSLSSFDEHHPHSKGIPIEEKILSCNPILEAFGNAKTIRNDNSSRFGKYVRILVRVKDKRIEGAAITNYLLEKSRVTTQAVGERNYHIFYHLLKSGDGELLKRIQIVDKPSDQPDIKFFEYLKGSNCFEVNGIDDNALFRDVSDSFSKMGFNKAEVDSVYSILSAVLFIGNLQFDASTLTDSAPCKISEEKILGIVASQLSINISSLRNAITLKTREVSKQLIISPMSKADCESSKHSLAKALFDKLFNWLVKRLNLSILPPEDLKQANSVRKSVKEVRRTTLVSGAQRLSIGLLDIFGFENFEVNSFEQLCINFTNEKLQQLYISYVFKSEEEEFIADGLKDSLCYFSYKDNQEVIDLIEKYPSGILHILDDSCSLASATDENLLQRLQKTHSDKPLFSTPKQARNTFTIQHTANSVEYTASGFRSKNKDEISKEIQTAVTDSKNIIISDIFKGVCGESERSAEDLKKTDKTQNTKTSDKFLGAKFRLQMKDLMNELTSCDMNFIRCIKPNYLKKKETFDQLYVLLQIRYLGVLESIKVRKEGFPFRKDYKSFYREYGELDGGQSSKGKVEKHVEDNEDKRLLKLSEVVIDNVFLNEVPKGMVLFGKKKIYLRAVAADRLDKALLEVWKKKKLYAIKIQKQYALFRKRKRIFAGLKAIHKRVLKFTRIQAFFRRKKARRVFLKKKSAVALIKKVKRKQKLRQFVLRWKEKIRLINAWAKKKKASVKIFNCVRNMAKSKLLGEFCQNVKWRWEKKLEKLSKEEAEKARLREEEIQRKKKEKEALEAELKEKEKKRLLFEEEQLRKKEQETLLQIKHEREEAQKRKSNMAVPEIVEKKEEEPEEDDEETKMKIAAAERICRDYSKSMVKFIFKEETQKPEEVSYRRFSEFETEDGDGKTRGEEKEAGVSLVEKYTEVKCGYVNEGREKLVPYSKDLIAVLNRVIPKEFLDEIENTKFLDVCENLVRSESGSWSKKPSKEEVLSYQRSSIKRSITKCDKPTEKLALNSFKYIKEFLRSKNEDEGLEKAARLMMLGWAGTVELRDEIFLQICKQMNGNPNTLEVHYLLKLMAIVSSAFQISARMIYPVLNFLHGRVYDAKERIETKLLAQYCFIRIVRFFERQSRKSPLLEYELRCIQELRMIMIDVYFPSGSRLYIPVESYTSTREAVETMMKMLNFQTNCDFYGLYLHVEKNGATFEERFLEDDELVLDVYSSLEILKFDQPSDSPISYKVFLRLRVFYKLNPTDINSLSYYYCQSFYDYCENKFPLSHEEISELAAHAVMKDYGKKCQQNEQTFHFNVEKYIPKEFVGDPEYPSNYWLAKISSKCRSLAYENKRECKMNFIRCLSNNLCFFMSYQFEVEYRGPQSEGADSALKKGPAEARCLLLVRPLELHLADLKTRKVFKSWHYKSIVKWGASSKTSFAMITGDECSHIFVSSKVNEIVYLIKGYSNLALGKPLRAKLGGV